MNEGTVISLFQPDGGMIEYANVTDWKTGNGEIEFECPGHRVVSNLRYLIEESR